jgi:hypothetical protein
MHHKPLMMTQSSTAVFLNVFRMHRKRLMMHGMIARKGFLKLGFVTQESSGSYRARRYRKRLMMDRMVAEGNESQAKKKKNSRAFLYRKRPTMFRWRVAIHDSFINLRSRGGQGFPALRADPTDRITHPIAGILLHRKRLMMHRWLREERG